MYYMNGRGVDIGDLAVGLTETGYAAGTVEQIEPGDSARAKLSCGAWVGTALRVDDCWNGFRDVVPVENQSTD